MQLSCKRDSITIYGYVIITIIDVMEEKEEIWLAPSLFPDEESTKDDNKQEAEVSQQPYVRDPDTPDYIIPYYEQINNIAVPSNPSEEKNPSAWYKVGVAFAFIGLIFEKLILGLLSLFGLYKLGSRS